MSKTSTELARVALNGPTMGTRWSALFFAEPAIDTSAVHAALQAAVDEVDAQMSTWNAASDLMRLNAAPVGEWVAAPERLRHVLRLGLEIGRASGGAFDIGMGDAVTAWGFGPEDAAPAGIRAAMSAHRRPAHEVLEIDRDHVRKSAPIALDLNGIAKGYGVDRLAETLRDRGTDNALVGIDGEMRATGLRRDGEAWTVAVEAPDPERRTPHSILGLQGAAVATSATGSKCRGGACRTRWTRSGACRLPPHQPPSPSWPAPVPRPMPGRRHSWFSVSKADRNSQENTGSTPCSSCAMMMGARGAWEWDDFFPKSPPHSS